MPENFLPAREADLLNFASNMNTLIVASPVSFGLDAAAASAFTALFTSFQTAYAAAVSPSSNSHANKVAKNNAKAAMIDGPGGIRELARLIQANPAVPDTRKAQLGLTVRDVEPSPIPPPSTAPAITIESVAGRQVHVRLRDAENPDRRGKPDGVEGATILTFVGAEAPADPAAWSYAFNTSKTVFDIDFPASVAVGAKVWVTAFWFNPRKQSSPPATPQSTHIGAGLAMAA